MKNKAETPYGKITLESMKEAVEYVFNQPRNIEPQKRQLKILRGCSTYGFYEFGKHCGNENCEPCNRTIKQFCEMLKEVVWDDFNSMYAEKWQQNLLLTDYKIKFDRINREQVTFPIDIEEKDKYFVGVNVEENTIVITHDRELTEEDILHELLHVANPEKSEEWINLETDRLLK